MTLFSHLESPEAQTHPPPLPLPEGSLRESPLGMLHLLTAPALSLPIHLLHLYDFPTVKSENGADPSSVTGENNNYPTTSKPPYWLWNMNEQVAHWTASQPSSTCISRQGETQLLGLS